MGRIALAVACCIVVHFPAWCAYKGLRWGRKGKGRRRRKRFGIGHREALADWFKHLKRESKEKENLKGFDRSSS